MRLVTGAYLVYLILPIALLMIGSFGESWTNSLLPTGFTLRWYEELLQDTSFSRAFVTSLIVVSVTGVLNILIGLPLAYAIYMAASRSVQWAARLLTLLPVAVPELVLAFGFILVFSSDALPWLGSIWLLIAGHVVLTLPYFITTLLSDMKQLRLDHMQAVAASLGGPFRSRFVDIVLPSLRYSLLSALVTVAAISIGEFQLSNLVAGFLNRTYPIVLLQAFYGATGFACAATVVLLVLAFIAASTGALTGRLAHRRMA